MWLPLGEGEGEGDEATEEERERPPLLGDKPPFGDRLRTEAELAASDGEGMFDPYGVPGVGGALYAPADRVEPGVPGVNGVPGAKRGLLGARWRLRSITSRLDSVDGRRGSSGFSKEDDDTAAVCDGSRGRE